MSISKSIEYYGSKVYPIHGIKNIFFDINYSIYDKCLFYYCGQIIIDFKGLKILPTLNINIDIYGNGPDINTLKKLDTNKLLHFKGKYNIDDLLKYKCYIAPSINEGLCTATIEAIVMHKYVIIPNCLCNELFTDKVKFPNVLIYNNYTELLNNIKFVSDSNNQPIQQKYNQFKLSNCNKYLHDIIMNS